MEWAKSIEMDATTMALIEAATQSGDQEGGQWIRPVQVQQEKLEELEKAMGEWAEQRVAHVNGGEKVRDVKEGRYAEWVLSFWPSVERDTRRAATLFKYLYWFVLFDDVVDDSASLRRNSRQVGHFGSELLEAMFGHVFDWTPQNLTSPKELLLVDVGREWWGEIEGDSCVSATQLLHFKKIVSEHVVSQVAFTRMNELMDEDKPPSVEEYIPVRREASGMFFCYLGAEYELGMATLDDHQPLLRQLQDAIANQCSWTNDLLSFASEHARGDYLNLLVLLHIQNNTTAQQAGLPFVHFHVAISQALDMINAEEKLCHRLAALLLATAADHNHQVPIQSHQLASLQHDRIKDYVHSLCGYMPALKTWTLRNKRRYLYMMAAPTTTRMPSQLGRSSSINSNINIILPVSFPRRGTPRTRMILSHAGTLQRRPFRVPHPPLKGIACFAAGRPFFHAGLHVKI